MSRTRFDIDVNFQPLLKDGAGTIAVRSNMAVDGSSTAVKFYSYIGTTVPIGIKRVNLFVIDGSITPGKFGGLTALTNGVKVELVDSDDAVVVDFLGGLTITNNAQWVLLAGSDNFTYPAAGDDQLAIRWTIAKGIGGPLQLRLGQRLRFTVQDDLEGLTEFRGMVQGPNI